MRQGVGAALPHRDDHHSVVVTQNVTATGVHSAQLRSNPARSDIVDHGGGPQGRPDIGRLFFDLRFALRITPHQAAAHLLTRPETILALETGQFELLPHWPETARIVMTYTALAGIDGRPVLAALADAIRASVQPVMRAKVQAANRQPADRLKQAGSAIASSAKRLPADAMKQVRERPERAFYAVSLPLGILMLLLNTSVLHAAISHVPRPVARMAQDVRQFFQEQFAPVREGLRWIEVDDPRRRRGDKLRTGS
jgi:hypothetical protein